MGAPKNKTYKRSVKNLLLDKSYQLRFTLFMVILSALLMGLLGLWVLRVADQATTVALNHIDGVRCPEVPTAASSSTEALPAEAPGDRAEEGAKPGEDGEGAAPEPERAADLERRTRSRPVVTIDDSQLGSTSSEPAVTAAEIAAAQAQRSECLAKQASKKASILDRKTLITWVLFGVGGLLIVGLFLYGIKMTHRVAGPLHKVSLYMATLRDGKYDTVYSLRKGDQLVAFYEHFKAAHAGLRKLQEEDRERLRDVLAAAEEADLASRLPELRAAIEELQSILAEQEDSLG